MNAMLAAALLFTSLGAAAQSAPGAEFLKLDRNRDGYISRVEAIADPEIAKRFALFDLNNDSRLSESEFAMAREDILRRALHDSAITARVKAALIAARDIPATSIGVDTYEGRVQLSGYAPAPELVSRAGRVTAGVHGVRTVHNDIAVR